MSYVISGLGMQNLLWLMRSRLFSVHHYYVLRINLDAVKPYPSTRKPPGKMIPMTAEDFESLKASVKALTPADRKELLARILFYRNGFYRCYMVRHEHRPAFLQWMITPDENPVISKFYYRIFYPLNPRQVMIENAFTFPGFRGRGYLPYYSRILLENAHRQGFKSAVGYIKKENIASLNEFYAIGFRATHLLTEVKCCGCVRRNLRRRQKPVSGKEQTRMFNFLRN